MAEVQPLEGDHAVASRPREAETARSSVPSTSAAIGFGSLAAAIALFLLSPASPLPVVLAAIAALALGRVPGLGTLAGPLVVVLAIPWGRGADVGTFLVAGFPVRAADAAIAVALLTTLPAIRRPRRRDAAILAVLGAFLAVGAVATGLGLLLDNTLRDVLRDVRWWGLYASLGMAILARVPSSVLLRGLDLGATVFAVVAIVLTIAPAVDGGLKDSALAYDRGTLRMQFGNTVFLLPAIARAVHEVMTGSRLPAAARVVLLMGAIVLSLTRTAILVAGGMSLLVVLLDTVALREPVRRRFASAAVVVAATVVSLGLGIGLATVAVLETPSPPAAVPGAPGVAPPTPKPDGENPLERITFRSEASDLESTIDAANGRMMTYANALAVIMEHPVLGAGMGSLVDVPFAYNHDRAYTRGKQPGVDNAYLTIGLKAGVVGIAIYAVLMLAPALLALRMAGFRRWFVPAYGAILVLTVTQSFAVSGYAPFALGLMLAAVAIGYAETRGATAVAQR